ncbi:CASTOR/POLLUX-related putative ion channel [Streptomyces lavendulae]|uniref:CASTOR/POLLUX-related putative ion channel n=1 Tax=Streptomyces lavendulae TaxID=1914 RepID=UPI0024A1240F|nr:lipoprotein [Streptomyces roseochromogenus]
MTGRRTTARRASPAWPRLRYWFDTIVARGTAVLIGWLTLMCLAIVVPASAALVWARQDGPTTWSEQVVAVWVSVGQTLKIGGAVGRPLYVLMSVLLALVALLFVSTLVSLITNGLNDKVLALRRGRSTVLEARHTVLLGWSDQVFPIISELVEANSNRRRAVIAVLGPKDKAEMEDEIATAVGRLGHTRLICRSGVTTDPAVVSLVSPQSARAVLVLTHEGEDGDAHVVKTLLAVDAAVRGRGSPAVVAAVRDGRHKRAADLAAGPRGKVLDIEDVTARLIAQTSCEPGLSLVYQELLDFDGDEIYTVADPTLTGRTFGELLLAYDTSSVIGLLRRAGSRADKDADGTGAPGRSRLELNPATDSVLGEGDRIVLITEDDDTATPAAEPLAVDERAIVAPPRTLRPPERFLLLGWNHRAPLIIDQLDASVPPGSVLVVMAEGEEPLREADRCARAPGRRMHVDVHRGDITDPRVLDDLDVLSFDRAIVLGYDVRDTAPGALTGDDRTLVTLLHLRALEEAAGRDLAVVTEMTDDRSRLLAPAREGADFIVGGRLISLLMTQIAENRHLAAVFDGLFSADGDTIHLRPATEYVRPGYPVAFATVVESGRRQGHCVIGYRLHEAVAQGPSYGVRLNPDKRERLAFGPEDSVIVLAPGAGITPHRERCRTVPGARAGGLPGRPPGRDDGPGGGW